MGNDNAQTVEELMQVHNLSDNRKGRRALAKISKENKK